MPRYNEQFIIILDQLTNIMSKQGEPFRARAYQKAQESIMNMTFDDITSVSLLKGKPNFGPAILEKLEEFVLRGSVDIIEKEKVNPVNILCDVYGIGPKKAQELVASGIRSIDDLRRNSHMLNNVQKIGLQYYEDILKRIPRSEIDQYHTVFNNVFTNHIPSKSIFEIVGSYRRGAETSGDIDVIINSLDPQVYNQFIDFLIKEGIILEVLSRGPSKCLVIAKLFSSDVARRVDFLFTSSEEYPFSLLYFTGSKIFNTVMRHVALTKGLTMNEHGLFDLSDKEKVKYTFRTEEDIFNYLGLLYKDPKSRIDGRAVVFKEASIPSSNSAFTLKQKPVEKKSVTRKRVTNSISSFLDEYKSKGLPVLESMTEQNLIDLIKEAKTKYYNSEPIMSDSQFDILENYFKIKFHSNPDIGAPVQKNKIKLPFFMGSMDKIKPDTDALKKWQVKFKGPYIISSKLDGVSGLFTNFNKTPKLYTRGDGVIGQDISHFIPYLKKYLPLEVNNIAIRGEFIIPKSVFACKYKKDFANCRNMVAGLINQKGIDEKIKDLHFVSYEVIQPQAKISDQLNLIRRLNNSCECVHFESLAKISNENLSKLLIELRDNSEYDIDGIIVADDANFYERKDGNPEHAFAFKMLLSDQKAEANVVDVIWTPSKDGYLKPRVRIEPIQLGGVQIEYVIPHINGVIVQASEPKMPNVDFVWNDTNVDILLANIDDDITVKSKNIAGFFKGIEVDGLSQGNIDKIINTGFDSVPKIIRMNYDDFLKVQGFQQKTATKLFEGIKKKLDEASILTLMAASNIFGRGFSKTKFELILSEFPDVLISNDSDSLKIRRITNMKGMADKSAEAFVSKIKDFCDFIRQCGLQSKLSIESLNSIVSENVVIDSLISGKSIIMTGFRNKDLEQKIKQFGGKIGSSVSKNTFVVIIKDLETEITGKLADAEKIGIPILTQDEFEKEYF
jgi:DNA ligase (NAD+)